MKEKELYESPAAAELELRTEGVFCASVDPSITDPFSGTEELDW